MKKLILAVCAVLLVTPWAFAAEPEAPAMKAPAITKSPAVCPVSPLSPAISNAVPAEWQENPRCPTCDSQYWECWGTCGGSVMLFECERAWPCDYTCECWQLE